MYYPNFPPYVLHITFAHSEQHSRQSENNMTCSPHSDQLAFFVENEVLAAILNF
jgi:hypothetical protein